MMASFLMRLLLAIVLVVNGTGSALASASGPAAEGPARLAAASAGSGKAFSPAGARDVPPGHEEQTSAATVAHGTAAADVQVAACHGAEADSAATGGDSTPAHGHCCHDACHCVCTLQAHAIAALVAPVPTRTMACLPPLPDWAAPDPALLLRPPIA